MCHLCLCCASVCSAGVGRTGTFIVIDAMIDMMYAEQKIDVFGFVSRIRDQRSQLVQTDVSTATAIFHIHKSATNVDKLKVLPVISPPSALYSGDVPN